jgi:S1-C subfamily serine protease
MDPCIHRIRIIIKHGVLTILLVVISLFILINNSNGSLAHAQELNPSAVSSLFSKIKESVVQVSATDAQGRTLVGSGFIYDTNGHIVTDYHIAVGKEKIVVTLSDGSTHAAKSIGGDLVCGPDILFAPTIPKGKLITLPIGDSKGLRLNENVVSIGNPIATSKYATLGMITGLGKIVPSNVTNYFYPIADIIQTNIKVNSSNYGGPLVNMKGQVIGANLVTSTWKSEPSNGGYIVPSNTIKKVVPSLIKTGFFEHPWIGIIGNNTSKEPRGVIVTSIIPGGPADKAKIQSGDLIVKIDNITVYTMDDILNYIQREKHVGDKLNLSILTDGQIKVLTLNLTARPHLQYFT